MSGLALAICGAFAATAAAQDQSNPAGRSEVERIVQLKGASRQAALKSLLARLWDTGDTSRPIFYSEAELRPGLRLMLNDLAVRDQAAFLLALFADPDDVRFMIHNPPASAKEPFANRWAYGVACSLLDAASEPDWAFLRKCAFNEYEDRWVDAGAIQTLKLIASPLSREILEQAQSRNPKRGQSVAKALEYIRSAPAPLLSSDLVGLAARVAQAVKIGDWEGNTGPRFNQSGDKALVDLRFQTEEDGLVYTAAFQKRESAWTLRGVRETLQMFAPRLPAIKKK